ncbi:MAG: hypothetical protein GY844_10065 [Bradyrhizobium sp.]|nr:hypothetical protein [Bradyrhizobium sp.]
MPAANFQLSLNEQEAEFAQACKDFVSERDPALGRSIIIENGLLQVSASSRQAFLDHGVARLLKVFRLAIKDKAIPLERIPTLIADLALFNEKVLNGFAVKAGNQILQ